MNRRKDLQAARERYRKAKNKKIWRQLSLAMASGAIAIATVWI